jgi:hypothetical protein
MSADLPRGDDAAVMTADEAIDALARRLYFKMEHFDPSGAPEWDDINEDGRAVYRFLVEDLFEDPSLVIPILRKELTDNDFMLGRP